MKTTKTGDKPIDLSRGQHTSRRLFTLAVFQAEPDQLQTGENRRHLAKRKLH
jgi:hypothetical protein